ncbi:hypothetical protein PS2_041764 [Malus domestica]
MLDLYIDLFYSWNCSRLCSESTSKARKLQVPGNMDGLRDNHSVDGRERRASHAAPQAGVGCSPFQVLVISQNMISASNFDLRIGIQSQIGLKSINFLTEKWSKWIGTWREKVAFLAIGKKNLRSKYATTQA